MRKNEKPNQNGRQELGSQRRAFGLLQRPPVAWRRSPKARSITVAITITITFIRISIITISIIAIITNTRMLRGSGFVG